VSRFVVSDEDDFDDLPATHLDDEAYEAFLKKERGPPPVGVLIGLVVVLLLAAAVLVLRR
jgi:hypothetical protein